MDDTYSCNPRPYIDTKRRAMYTIYMLGKFLPSPVFRVKVT